MSEKYTTIQISKTLAQDFRDHCNKKGYVISALLERIILQYLSGSIGQIDELPDSTLKGFINEK